MATAAKKTASAGQQSEQAQRTCLAYYRLDLRAVLSLTARRNTLSNPRGSGRTISNWLSVDPGRSSGVPLTAQFRLPTPGGLDPKATTTPSQSRPPTSPTTPTGSATSDDRTRALSVVKQADVVGLLTVGSAAHPKEDVLKLGEAGTQQLVAVKEEGEKGLSTYFAQNKAAFKGVLGPEWPAATSGFEACHGESGTR
ncbi:hypothetical protein MRB53_038162 [Persea americana]|nr:hypothetical protein MRB53_038162 [Persea americana]